MASSELPESEHAPEFQAYCAYLDLIDELGEANREQARRQILERYPNLQAQLRELFQNEPGTTVPADFQSGSVIAERYRLLKKLGEGGMGTVWLAEQLEPVRRFAALKLIKRGMDSEQILARFDAERQALAMMEHDSIARFYEAGMTAEGRSFFVMEYVAGEPIDRFCDSVALSLKRRLELFQTVCAAIQHAHQKGIIHRDLKPSNILVADQQDKLTVKIIDFGLAKAVMERLTDASIYTEHGQIIGTLQYMPPEQAELSALDIDTRADVYALGAVLYELIAGTPPLLKSEIQNKAFVAILELIRDSDVPRPSVRLSRSQETIASIAAARRTEPKRLLAELQGDLDWITLKALEKDRRLRYGSAEDLRRDVERYLNHEPIAARPPSFAYRTKKWLKRHRIAAAFLAVVVLALLITFAGISYGLFQSQHSLGVANAAKEEEAQQAALAREQTGLAEEEALRAMQMQALAEQQRKISDIRLYARTLSAAADAARRGELEAGNKLLESTDRSLRGFEYDHCRNSMSKLEGKTQIPGYESCTAIAVGPKRIFDPPRPEVVACGTAEGSVLIGSLESQLITKLRLTRFLTTKTGLITSLEFSESARLLVIGTEGGRVAVADLFKKDNRVITKFDLPGLVVATSIRAVDDHRQEKLENVVVAAADENGSVRVWDVIQSKEMASFECPGAEITSIAVGDEYDQFALVIGQNDGALRFWSDLQTKEPQFVERTAHPGGVLDVELTDLGVATCGRDGNRMEWKVKNSSFSFLTRPDLISTWMRRSQIPAIKAGQIGKMSPDVIWVGLDAKSMQEGKKECLGCFLEDTRTGAIQTIVLGLDDSLENGEPILFDISGTGNFMAVGVGTNVHLRQRVLDLVASIPKSAVARIPGLKLDLRTDPMKTLFLVEFPDFASPLQCESPVVFLARSHALDLLATVSQDRSLSLWRVKRETMEAVHTHISLSSASASVTAITDIGFSRDDQWLLICRETELEIVSILPGKSSHILSFSSSIQSFDTTANGEMIVSTDRGVYLFPLSQPQQQQEISLGKSATSVALHPTGKWLAGITGADELCLHELATNRSHFLDHPGVSALLFLPQEPRLVAVGRSLRLWDLDSLEKVWDEELPPNQRSPAQISLVARELGGVFGEVLVGIADLGEFWQLQTWAGGTK